MKVTRLPVSGALGGETASATQNFVYPNDIFEHFSPGVPLFWTCVRTRPRWEKKFTTWLAAEKMTHFLPTIPHTTFSGRKRRVSELPLFPGFVFVEGNHSKRDFERHGKVVYVLKPASPREVEQLHRELAGVWNGLTSGLYIMAVNNLAAGESCRIACGPLQGVQARYERPGRAGHLILQVELMGGGIAVEVPAEMIELLK